MFAGLCASGLLAGIVAMAMAASKACSSPSDIQAWTTMTTFTTTACGGDAKDNERVIMAVEEEAEVGLAVALAVPAVFMNRKFGFKTVRRVVIKTVVERRIEKPFVMPEMVKVGHGQDARAARAEDFQQQPVDMVELGFELVEQH